MDTNTEMCIGFLILDWVVFLPLIIIGVVGVLTCKYQLKQIDKDLEEIEYGE